MPYVLKIFHMSPRGVAGGAGAGGGADLHYSRGELGVVALRLWCGSGRVRRKRLARRPAQLFPPEDRLEGDAQSQHSHNTVTTQYSHSHSPHNHSAVMAQSQYLEGDECLLVGLDRAVVVRSELVGGGGM